MAYGIQQPAISGQLAQLEQNLGVRLFERRPFKLTPAGARLFSEIKPFFSGLKDLPAQIRGSTNHHLRLAAPAIALRDYLPKILLQYKRRHRDFRLTLHDANQASAEELLRKGEIDLAITELERAPAASVKCSVLARLSLSLAIPISEKAREIDDFFGKGVATTALISLPANEAISKQFQDGLRKRRRAWPPAVEVSSLELVELYSSIGFGVGLSLALPRSQRKSGVRYLKLRNFPALKIAALWTSELSEIAERFLGDVRRLGQRLDR